MPRRCAVFTCSRADVLPNVVNGNVTLIGVLRTSPSWDFHATELFHVLLIPSSAVQESGPSELEEVEVELDGPPANGKGGDKATNSGGMYKRMLSTVIMKAFTMTFLAEWGDRSQIATISLAAEHDVVGVTLGGCVGHCICTGAAVLGGRQLAQVIDEKTVNIVGGVMFLFFGALTWYEGVEDQAISVQ